MDESLDLLLVDGRHLLWRAASVFGDLHVKRGDEEIRTGAMYGFLRLALMSWQKFGGHVLVAWESPNGPTARQAIFKHYKRKPHPVHTPQHMPKFDRASAAQVERELVLEDMRVQEEQLKNLLSTLGWRQGYILGWEADDVIATMCRHFDGNRIGILSGDRDLLQLVTENTTLIRPQPKGQFKLETPDSIKVEWGIRPQQILDMKALAGDPGDNVPGAPGIGPKTATKLILEHGGWEETLKWALANPPQKRWHQALVDNAEAVRMSARLVALNPDGPICFQSARPDRKRAFLELARFKFSSLLADGRQQALMAMGSG